MARNPEKRPMSLEALKTALPDYAKDIDRKSVV